jgi:hypothetical protein
VTALNILTAVCRVITHGSIAGTREQVYRCTGVQVDEVLLGLFLTRIFVITI